MFGYNGFGRLTGNETGSVGGGGRRRSPWGTDRPDPAVQRRLRRPDLVAAARGAAPARRPGSRSRGAAAHRPHARRADALGRLAGRHRGAVQLRPGHHPPLLHGRARPGDRRGRRHRRGHALVAPRRVFAQYALAAVFAVTVVWSYVLLDRTPTWHPWLRVVVGDRRLRGAGRDAGVAVPRRGARAVAVAVGAVVVASARPGRVHARDRGDAAHRRDPVGRARPSRAAPGRAVGARRGSVRAASAAARRSGGFGRRRRPGRRTGAGSGGQPGGGGPHRARCGRLRRLRRRGGAAAAAGSAACSTARRVSAADEGAARRPAAPATAGSPRPSTPTTRRATNSRPGKPVMAIGGFNGTDPSPTLAQFEHDVAKHEIHYFIGGWRRLRRRARVGPSGSTVDGRSRRGSRATSPRRPSAA